MFSHIYEYIIRYILVLAMYVTFLKLCAIKFDIEFLQRLWSEFQTRTFLKWEERTKFGINVNAVKVLRVYSMAQTLCINSQIWKFVHWKILPSAYLDIQLRNLQENVNCQHYLLHLVLENVISNKSRFISNLEKVFTWALFVSVWKIKIYIFN